MNEQLQDSLPALVIAGGPRNGEKLVIELPGAEKILGSGPDSHLRLTGASIDYHHAGVLWDETAGVLLTDQASATGTWVNGERVTAPRPLQDGDRISLGPPGAAESIKLLVEIPAQLEAPLVLDAEDGGPAALGQEEVFDASGQTPIPTPIPAPISTASPATPLPPLTAPPPPTPPPPPARLKFKDEEPPPSGGSFTDQLPSIVADRPRRPAPRPASRERPRTARRSGGKLLPALAAAVVLAVVGGAGFFAYRILASPAPALAGATPARVEPGQAVTLTGTGFADSPNGNTVRFGEARGTVTAATPTQLTVSVPPGLEALPEVAVSVETRGGRSNALRLPVRIAPRIAALEPDVALPGADVVIRGQKLDGKNLTVTVGGVRATIKEASPTAVRFEVPRLDTMIEGQGVIVALSAGGEAARSQTLTLGHLPLLLKIEPARGQAGDRLVIRGRGFEPDPMANVVTFAGEPGLVVAATERQLDVILPAVPASSNLFNAPVVVRAHGSDSRGPFDFAVLRPSSAIFVPRFFPAPVPSDPGRVFVSSEAGPLLMLSSRDGSPSLQERALRVAAAANTLFAPGATGAAIEVRGGDPPAVQAAGRPQPVVRATAEDAAGYAQPWNTSMKGQRVSPSTLAAHWAALLQDYVTLFLQHQRPTRVAEVTPRGKVMLELHAEGERRLGAGGGVPAVLLMPPSPSIAYAMRELALAVPSRAQSVPGAALVGRWAGTMEEVNGGARAIQVVLRLEGTRLAGSITTRSGKLSMDVPLKAVTYEKGTLTFEVGGGAFQRFRGSASGSTLSGAILDQAHKQIGTFSLQYLE